MNLNPSVEVCAQARGRKARSKYIPDVVDIASRGGRPMVRQPRRASVGRAAARAKGSTLLGRGYEDGADELFDLLAFALGAASLLFFVFLDRHSDRELLAALRAAVVVDGHSTDSTDRIAEREGATVYAQTSKGKGNAIIEVLPSIKRPYVLMLDGDGTYSPRDADRMLEPLFSRV
jgi:hypothetical protein